MTRIILVFAMVLSATVAQAQERLRLVSTESTDDGQTHRHSLQLVPLDPEWREALVFMSTVVTDHRGTEVEYIVREGRAEALYRYGAWNVTIDINPAPVAGRRYYLEVDPYTGAAFYLLNLSMRDLCLAASAGAPHAEVECNEGSLSTWNYAR